MSDNNLRKFTVIALVLVVTAQAVILTTHGTKPRAINITQTNMGNDTNMSLQGGSRVYQSVWHEDFDNLDKWNQDTNDGRIGVDSGVMYEQGVSNNWKYENPTIWLKNPVSGFGSPAHLKFHVKFSRDDGYKKGWTEVKLSTDGSNWDQVWSRGSDMGWTDIDIDISNYAGSNVYILIHTHTATAGDHVNMDWIEIDGTVNSAPSPPTSITPDSTHDKTPTISWSGASDPEGDTLSYEIQIGTTSGGSDILSWASTGQSTSYTVSSPLSITTYYVQVRSYDGALYSNPYEIQMTVVNSPPTPPTDIQPDTTGSRKPQISWSGAQDPDIDDVITDYRIQIGTTSGGSEFIGWTDAGSSGIYDVTTQMEFTTYYVQVKAYDGYAWSDVHEEQLVIDAASNSPPNAPSSITPDTTYDVTPQISWPEATDPDDDSITDYQIQIGTTSGGSDILSWTSTGGNRFYQVDSALAVGIYYAQVKAYDGNSWSGVREETIEIMNTPPTAPSLVKIDGYTLPTSVSNKYPTLTWSGASDINSEQQLAYYVSVARTSDGSQVLDWTYTTSALYTFTSILAVGEYTVSILTTDSIDNSTTSLDNTFNITNTAPPMPTWANPNTTTDKSPMITWEDVTDSDGDTVHYYLQIGTINGGDDIFPWSYVDGTSFQMNRTLVPGTYYIQIKAFDGLDYSLTLESEMDVENNPPSAPDEILPHSTSIQMPNITWDMSIDPDNDMVTYLIEVGSTSGAGDIIPWTDTNGKTYYQVSSPLSYGDYYVQVRAFDNFDYSAIKEELMHLASGANSPPDRPTTLSPEETNITTPLIDWDDCQDPDGDTVTYEIRAGTQTGGSDIFDWTSVTESQFQVTSSAPLVAGVNYIQIRSYDGTDYSSTFQDTITVNLGTNLPPGAVSEIRPTITVLTTPTITWKAAVDPNGDMLEYFIQIGTSTGASDVLPWTSTGTQTSYNIVTPLDSGIYFVQVKANDGELDGPVTEAQMEIRSTNSPPLPPTMITPAETKDTTPLIYWYGASDPDHNTLTYELQIGTSTGASDVLVWTSTGSSNSYQIPDNSPLDYGTYYVQVKAFDGSDYSDVFEATLIISETANSPPNPPNKLKPQSTPQTTPTIYWYGASDPDGDSLTYWLQIGTTPGGSEIMSWTNASDASYRITRSLDQGTYYVQIMSYDGKQNSSVFETTLDIVLEGNRAPTSPTVIQPTETLDTTPNITWSGADDADGDTIFYWIRIGTTFTGSEVIPWTYTGPNSYYQVTQPLLPGTYYVFVLSFDGIDNASIPTGGTMTVLAKNNRLPDGPDTFSPETTSNATPTISWSGASDLDGDELSYFLAVGTTQDNTDILNWTYIGNTNNYTFRQKLSVGTYFVMLKAFDGTGNSSVVVNTLRIVPPFTYGFEAELDTQSIDVNRGSARTVTLTLRSTGTGDDKLNVSLEGSMAQYAYINEKVGSKQASSSLLKENNRFLDIPIEAGSTKKITIVVYVPEGSSAPSTGTISVKITSENLNITESRALNIKVSNSVVPNYAGSSDMWMLMFVIILIIIALIVFFIVKRRKKDEEDGLSDETNGRKELSDDDFNEDFDDVTPSRPVSPRKPKAKKPIHSQRNVAEDTEPKNTVEGKEGSSALSSLDMSELDSELEEMEQKELEKLRHEGK